MKLILKNSDLVFASKKRVSVTVGPDDTTLLALSTENTGVPSGYKASNGLYHGGIIDIVNAIRFKVSNYSADHHQSPEDNQIRFYKMSYNSSYVLQNYELIASYDIVEAEIGTIKVLVLDSSVELGENDYIAINGNFFYNSTFGNTYGGSVSANTVDSTAVRNQNSLIGLTLQGFKYIE